MIKQCRQHQYRRLFPDPQNVPQALNFAMGNYGRYFECMKCGHIGRSRKSRRAPIVRVAESCEGNIRERLRIYIEASA